jgi:hypothetical protein
MDFCVFFIIYAAFEIERLSFLFLGFFQDYRNMCNLIICANKNKFCALIIGHCTEVHFASLLSSGFTIMAVINPPESKLAKRTSMQSDEI